MTALAKCAGRTPMGACPVRAGCWRYEAPAVQRQAWLQPATTNGRDCADRLITLWSYTRATSNRAA